MLSIQCQDVTKRFERTLVLDRVRWTIPAGEVVALLGGSGAGKTTLLRLIAGLIRCTTGQILFDRPSALTPALSRKDREPSSGRPRVGMVFQNLALWPHLTARQHLACVLYHLSARDRRRRAESLLSESKLPAAVWNHRPAQLSGGEAQRLALARMLAAEPEILLLDEPLAHLDSPLKSELMQVIRECVGSRRLTCVFVTHSWDEAIQLCGRVAVLDGGRLAQVGTPAELYWRPLDLAVARWTGPIVELRQSWLDDGLLASTNQRSPLALAQGEDDKILVRPQQLAVVAATNQNRWRVVEARPQAGGWLTTVELDENRLSFPVPYVCRPGDCLSVQVRPAADWIPPELQNPPGALSQLNCRVTAC